MNALKTVTIQTPYGEKSISVCVQDIAELRDPIDIMTVSAFYRSYGPTPKTMMHALFTKGISVQQLSETPQIDLRHAGNIWLSQPVEGADIPIGRIGCIEMSPYRQDRGLWREHETQIIASIQSYFHMLHIAALSGIKADVVGLPILGAGSQQIDTSLIIVPTLNECFRFLKTCESTKEIRILTNNQAQAFQFAQALEKSYAVQKDAAEFRQVNASEDRSEKCVFISYSSLDRNIADNLCAKLEANGIKVWYAPRNIISSDYAGAIVSAITRCTHFIVIISKNSLKSHHVLNEIDLAFQELNRCMHLIPLRIDEEEMGPSFRYYLCSQHWMDAHVPPLEKRLDECVSSILTI